MQPIIELTTFSKTDIQDFADFIKHENHQMILIFSRPEEQLCPVEKAIVKE